MLHLVGKSNAADVYVKDNILDSETYKQILQFIDMPMFTGGHIAIMPDCHAGKGSCVGFTMTLGDFVVPDVVGVDIGCGVLAVNYGKVDGINLPEFDAALKAKVPCGFAARDTPLNGIDTPELHELRSRVYADEVAKSMHALASCGTLGGGNHFIELDHDGDDNLWAVIHTGSRNLGVKVNSYHNHEMSKAMPATGPQRPRYAPIRSELAQAYLHDMRVTQEFAVTNRKSIATAISAILGARPVETVESVHNYIDVVHGVIRKGAVSAMAGEPIVLPLNSADGTVLGVGLGNSAWNESAPHGAGRCLSRSEAKATLKVEDYQEMLVMHGIYSSTANASTLDEAPMAYKPAQGILDEVVATMTVQHRLMPIYNFKAEAHR